MLNIKCLESNQVLYAFHISFEILENNTRIVYSIKIVKCCTSSVLKVTSKSRQIEVPQTPPLVQSYCTVSPAVVSAGQFACCSKNLYFPQSMHVVEQQRTQNSSHSTPTVQIVHCHTAVDYRQSTVTVHCHTAAPASVESTRGRSSNPLAPRTVTTNKMTPVGVKV